MSQDRYKDKTGDILPQSRSIALIALGSNQSSDLGAPSDIIDMAVSQMGDSGLKIRSVSRFFSTPAFPAGSGPDFVNAALATETTDTPEQLLSRLHEVEKSLQRERNVRWGQRTIDLDLIAFDQCVTPDAETHKYWRDLALERQMQVAPDQLLLPHPRVQDRAFVLVPLADVAPDWVHPILGLSVMQMLEALPRDAKEEIAVLQ